MDATDQAPQPCPDYLTALDLFDGQPDDLADYADHLLEEGEPPAGVITTDENDVETVDQERLWAWVLAAAAIDYGSDAGGQS